MVKGTLKSSENPENEFLQAYDDFSDSIFRFCWQKTGSRESALDLTQLTFMRAWNHLKEGKTVTHWRGFLYRIARNAVFDEYRKQGLVVKLEKIDLGDLDIQDSSVDLERFAENDFLTEKLKKYLSSLSDTNRDIVAMKYLENLSLDEIAIALDLSKNAISVRLHRAQKELQDLIKKDQEKYE